MAHFGYLRVSTLVQAIDGVGLDAQRHEIEVYCKANGIAVKEWFEDAGVSANLKDNEGEDALSRRAGLMRMLNVLEAGDTVITASTSRLWRSDAARVIVRRELLKRGAQVISVENPRFSLTAENANDRFLDGVAELVDVLERATVCDKLARGRAARAATGGRACGRIPYGYRKVASGVEVDTGEAAIVKRIYSMAQKGANLNQICKTLNGEGIRNHTGKEWGRGAVRAIVRNPFYKGLVVYQGQTYTGSHEAIISPIVWGKVAAQLAKRARA